jgi:hypothetical protein
MIPHGNHFKVFPTGAGVMHEVMFCIFNVCWFSCLTLSWGAEWFPWPTAHTCCPSDATPGGDASDHDITLWCSSSRYEQFWRWCYIFFSTTYSTYSWRVATPTLREKSATSRQRWCTIPADQSGVGWDLRCQTWQRGEIRRTKWWNFQQTTFDCWMVYARLMFTAFLF